MADLSKIEWCDATLNLWWGCTKVSDGCKFCYANDWDSRYHPTESAWGPTGKRREVKSWRSTLNKISKRAKAESRRLRVFCQSMSDTFEGPETMGGRTVFNTPGDPFTNPNYALTFKLRKELLLEIEAHPELDFLLLTKRPENVMRMTPMKWAGGLPTNLWIGTSVENREALHRLDDLRNIPAAVRFVSNEPAIGNLGQVNLEGIHWWIAGGESGPNARPMHPDWARSLRDQCVAAEVPFFFKQWGEWMPENCVPPKPEVRSIRVGKARAGRLLDGREWNEFPEVANG